MGPLQNRVRNRRQESIETVTREKKLRKWSGCGKTAAQGLKPTFRGIIPFVILQLCALALLMAFPDIALWLPRVLLN